MEDDPNPKPSNSSGSVPTPGSLPATVRQIRRNVDCVSTILGFVPERIQEISERIQAFSDRLGMDENHEDPAELQRINIKLNELSPEDFFDLKAQFDAMYSCVGKISVHGFNELFPQSKASDSDTNLDDLPDELLAKIFFWIPTEALIDVTLTSPRWKRIVHEDVGLEVCISDWPQRKATTGASTVDPEILSEFAIQGCHVRMVTGSVPPLKYPDKLKFLTFRAPVTAPVFLNLVPGAVNLSQLQFFYSSLSADDLTKVQVYLPNLKLLHFCDRSLESGDMSNPEYIVQNIVALLGYSYPSLIELKVSVVADHSQSETLVLSLLKFLQNQYETIRRVRFNLANALTHVLLLNPNLHQVFQSVEFTKQQTACLDWSKLSQVRLDILELDFGKNFVVAHKTWERFLESQSMLKELILFRDAGVTQEVFTSPVLQSFETLVYLHLGVDTTADGELDPRPIDCSVFEACRNLRKFGIFGIVRETRHDVKELLNINKLSNKILALVFRNVNVGSEDLENLVFGMRHIVKLCCDNIGGSNELGMTLKLLKKILMGKKSREVVVKGFNPAESDAAAHAEFARVYELNTSSTFPNCHFHAKFNEELGQYISICM